MKVELINMTKRYGFTISTPSIQVHVQKNFATYIPERTVFNEMIIGRHISINICLFIWAVQFRVNINTKLKTKS